MNDTHATPHESAHEGAHRTGPEHIHAPLGYGLLTAIWVALMACTALTVAVAGVDLGFLNVAVALAVASLKAGLVVFFFMHLRYENWLLKGMVLTAFVILAIAIGLTFVDVGYRY